VFDVKFGKGSFIPVAELLNQDLKCASDTKLVLIKKLLGPHVSKQIQILQEIQYPRFFIIKQIYRFEDSFYAVFDELPLSLLDIKKSPFLKEIGLASILGQVRVIRTLIL
jgi:hypothetical protein